MHDQADDRLAWLGISVLNWNNAPDTIRCLDGLHAAGAFDQAIVIVVDNGSSDGSADRLARWLADRPHLQSVCRLIRLESNGGYGAGNNVAIRVLAGGNCDWIWVMNNDAWISPESFDRLVRTLRAESTGWDVLGVRLHEPGGSDEDDIVGGGVVSNLGARGKPVRVKSQSEGWDSIPVVAPDLDFIHGANLIVRPHVLRRCGLLPEDHFLFWEEVDFSRRALDAGYRIGVASTVIVQHAEGTTSGVRDRSNKTRLAHYYAARSTILYTRKHRRTVAPAFVIRSMYALAVAFRQRDPRAGTAVLRGLRDGARLPLQPPPQLDLTVLDQAARAYDLVVAKRGWFTLAYGDHEFHWMAQNLALAMRRHLPGVAAGLATDNPTDADRSLFDVIAPLDMSRGRGMWQKFWLDHYAPFDEALYVDSDCLPVADLDFVWEVFTGVPFGVVGRNIAPMSEPLFAQYIVREWDRLPAPWRFESYPIFNGGLFLIRRGEDSRLIFEDARFLSHHFEEYGLAPMGDGTLSDEPALSLAMARSGVRAVDQAPHVLMRTTAAIGEPLSINTLARTPKREPPARIIHFAGSARRGRIYRREALALRVAARRVPASSPDHSRASPSTPGTSRR